MQTFERARLWPHSTADGSTPEQTQRASGGSDATSLIIHSDRATASAMRAVLEEAGITARIVTSIEGIGTRKPDLIVLDTTSTDSSVNAIHDLRCSGAGIVAIGPRLSIRAICALLNAGADDWIAAPFHPEEFRARCIAVLRRRRPTPRRVLMLGRIELDVDAWWATIDGRPVSLTREDWLVLSKLARRPGAVVSHAEIVGTGHSPGSQHSLARARVGRLRRRLAAAGVPGQPIRLAEGHGYRLDESSLWTSLPQA